MLDQIGTGGNIHLISTTQEVPRYLDASDIFVLPSMFEGMPISIMEAMAKGLPVVATAVSGTSEELGTTGIFLPDPKVDPEQTITGLTDALEKLATDDIIRSEMGAECRRRAEKLFTQDRMVANYLQLIETLLVMRSVASTN
jgi:glycosyltransferase involved in cell wall biosynthesis